MFYKLHLERSEGETWEEYNSRLMTILAEAKESPAYKAILDLIEAFVRVLYEKALKNPTEERWTAAQSLHQLYRTLERLEQQPQEDLSEADIEAFAMRAPEGDVLQRQRLDAARAAVSTRGRGPRGRPPNM